MKERLWIVAPRVGGGGFLRAPSLRAAVWEANQRGWRVYREGWDADGDRVWAMEPAAMREHAGRFELCLELLDGYSRATEPEAEAIGVMVTPRPAAPKTSETFNPPRPAASPRGAAPPPSQAQRGLFG